MKTTTQSCFGNASELRFLFGCARRYAHGVIKYTVLTACVALGAVIVEWLAVPAILYGLEMTLPLTTMLWTVVGFTVLIAVLRFAQRYTEGGFSESRDRFRTRGSTELVKKALTTSYPHAADPQKRQRLQRAAAAMGRHIHAPIPGLWYSLSQLLFHAVGTIVFAVLLLSWNVAVTLTAAATAVLGALVHRAVSRRGVRHHEQEVAQDAESAYVSHVAESSSFSKDIRVFGLQGWLRDLYDRTMRATEALLRHRGRVYFLYNAADAVLSFLRNAVAYTVLLQAVFDGAMPLSALILYFTAIGGFTEGVGEWLKGCWSLKASLAELRVYREVLSEEEPFLTEGGMVPRYGTSHTLELRDVSYMSSDASAPSLSHLELTLRTGETVAVVGEDSLGKSALVQLLCGLSDPTDGKVLLDGTDVRLLDRRAYYALLSTVLPNSAVPAMTIGEIVSSSSDTVDRARVESCLKVAGLADAVRALPQGVDAHIGRAVYEDGVELSSGQHQRLMLARALYKNGDIWILDEPQGALDPLAEHAFYQEFVRLSHGKSVVVFSHRLAVTPLCDRVVYIKNGTIAEEGTHDELMAKHGDYARLFRLQSRYYREGRDPDVETIGE